jgi:Protein kinase domain/Repeat of unknown function (DUF5648)
MGTVFRAFDRREGCAVALKILRGRDDVDVERFVREAAILAELRHPHIVRYADHGLTESGEHYLAMEWLDGEDLAERIARKPLSDAEAVTVVAQAASALGFAHAHGAVHRDIKPSNLFLRGGAVDRICVLDFGIAGLSADPRKLTQTGTLLGTPGYVAPEQVQGSPIYDPRSDVFSLGCVLFECLVGRPAFVAEHVLALLGKILREDPPRLRQLVPHASPDIEDLLAAMLAKDPAARPADMAAIAEALGRGAACGDDAEGPATDVAGAVVFRWWSVAAADHFYTTDASGERALTRGYTYEGVRFRTLREGSAGTVPLFRWYSGARAEHFYTTDPEGERAHAAGYRPEGVLGHVATAALPGTVPLHRWWNPSCCDHFYTTDPGGELAPQLGYEYQGVVAHVLPADARGRYGGDDGPVRSGPEAPSGLGAADSGEPSGTAEASADAGALGAVGAVRG